ncbi:MAG TPA: hypothetical protein VGJ09_18185 [Bryobacteraceae bacterium]
MGVLSNVIGIAGILSQLVLLYLLLRGPFRRYFFIFAYCLAQTIQTVVDGVVLRKFGQSSPQYRSIFWTDALMVDVLLFLLVIVLTYQAMEGNPIRPKMTRILAVIAGVVFLLPFVVLNSKIFFTRWFNGTDQILNFGTAIMNLALWTALLGSKKRDAQLLTITAGLGVRVAAVAVLLGLRRFTLESGVLREVADVAVGLAFIAGTLIWCWAFRPATRPGKSPAPAMTPASPM